MPLAIPRLSRLSPARRRWLIRMLGFDAAVFALLAVGFVIDTHTVYGVAADGSRVYTPHSLAHHGTWAPVLLAALAVGLLWASRIRREGIAVGLMATGAAALSAILATFPELRRFEHSSSNGGHELVWLTAAALLLVLVAEVITVLVWLRAQWHRDTGASPRQASERARVWLGRMRWLEMSALVVSLLAGALVVHRVDRPFDIDRHLMIADGPWLPAAILGFVVGLVALRRRRSFAAELLHGALALLAGPGLGLAWLFAELSHMFTRVEHNGVEIPLALALLTCTLTGLAHLIVTAVVFRREARVPQARVVNS